MEELGNFCNIKGFPEVFNSLVFKSLPLEQNVPEP